MTVTELFAELARRGVHVSADGHDLTIRAPKGALTPSLRAALAEQKAEILTRLRHGGPDESRSGRTRQTPGIEPVVTSRDVAIIGMAGRFPGANNLDEFWANLRDGVESISFFSDEELEASGVSAALRHDSRYVKASPILPHDAGLFDAPFFGFTPREAELMDPQQRILLEVAWEALDHAGYDSDRFDGRIGIYAGASLSTYLFNLVSNPGLVESVGRFHILIRNDKDYLTTNISYKMNLRGPSMAVQTACSTSLVAVHLACQSLLTGESDMALAGGVRVVAPQKEGYLPLQGGVYSPDGHCRAFDHKAGGTLFGSGAGLVVLKRLADAIADRDEIHAVIKASAINNDGAMKFGYTAPGLEGEAQVIGEAQRLAGIDPDAISYVETHGTGTPLGDPIEVAALTRAFRAGTSKKGFCAIGSVKSNIGHLEAAAGVASLIKTVLALKHRTLPPSLHFEQPNPQIDFANSPFYVNARLSPWTSGTGPRLAGVSSHGIGGTNSHVILEEAPPADHSPSQRPWHLLVISAKTASALEAATTNLTMHLRQHPEIDLADAAYTTHVGRRAFAHRRALLCRTQVETPTIIASVQPPRDRPMVFMFPGQGTQYARMAEELYQTEPVFRSEVDRCADLLIPHLGLDLREALYRGGADVQQTAMAQPAIFVIEYALARLWMAWGVRPQGMIGHSVGEYVAACLAGVFSLEDALALVSVRGQLMQALPPGAMLAVALPESELLRLLPDGVSLAAVNGPALCTVAGPIDAIERLAQRLNVERVECRRLHTSHAFHSGMMEPILDAFHARVKAVTLSPPRLPYVSNLTGAWMTAEDATDPSYWTKHLRHTVRFADGLQAVQREPDTILLEVGPGHTLGTCARQQSGRSRDQLIVASMPGAGTGESAAATMMTVLGRLWLSGASVDWQAFHAHEQRRRVALPSYPFERQRYWIDALPDNGPRLPQTPSAAEPVEPRERSPLPVGFAAPDSELERIVAGVWQELLGIPHVGRHDNFFELGGHSLLMISLGARLQGALQLEIPHRCFLEAHTVAEMAQFIAAVQRGEEVASSSPLVVIQAGSQGTKAPFFCVHPNAGRLRGFVELSRHLGADRPFYGLQTLVSQPTVEAMAAQNLEAMRSVQAHGPYLLGGYSFGGIVAFEMARQLESAGESLALLALLDSAPMPRDARAENLPDESVFRAWFTWELERAGTTRLGAPDTGADDASGLFALFKGNMEALWRYQPGQYAGHLAVFKAQEAVGAELLSTLPTQLLQHVMAAQLADTDYGWGMLAPGRTTVHSVPGNHYSMLAAPHVAVVATQLHRVMVEALPEQTAATDFTAGRR